LPFHERWLPVLLALEVVLEALPGRRAQGAIEAQLGCARRDLTFVDRREVRSPDRLRGERRHAERHRPGAGEHQPPASQHRWPLEDDREHEGRRGDHADHVVRVAETEQVRGEEELAIGARRVRIVEPPQREPGDDRDAEERERVDLLADYRLIPDGESGGAEQRRKRSGDELLPALH
jgi:hypothetical protein